MLILGRYAGQEIILKVGEETIVVKFVEMNGKQAKIAQRAVGKARGRDGEVAFGEENLHGAAFDTHVEVG